MDESQLLTKTQYLIQRLSSKKFFLTLFVIVLISVLLLFDYVDKTTWKDFVQWMASLFLGADASQEIGKRVADNMKNGSE